MSEETPMTLKTIPPSDLADLKVSELKALAADDGIEIPPKAVKAEILALLAAHLKATKPRAGQLLCKFKGCGAPLRIRSTRAPVRTSTGIEYQTRYVQCKGPRGHRYKIVTEIRQGPPATLNAE